MKLAILIINTLAAIIALCLCACCGGQHREVEIAAIDSIADTDAPRALTLLDSLKPHMAGATEAEWSLYSLVRVKAEDKAFVEHKTDTVMLRLIDYYETDGDKTLLPQVYYYAGRVYADMDDGDRALKYFQKVEELTDSTNALYDKAQLHTGSLFLYQGLYEKGIEAFRHSYEYHKREGNKLEQADALCGIAQCLQRSGSEEQALRYFNQALRLSRKAGDKQYEAEITAQIANHYYQTKQYDTASKYIKRALTYVDSIGVRPVYAIAADIYYKVGNEDSAIILYKKLYSLDDVYAKYRASKRLGHYYLKHKDMAKAAFYLDEYDRYADSIQTITQTETVAKIDAIYNYNIREEENDRLKAKIMKEEFTVTIIVIFAISVILALTALLSHLKKKR